MDRTTHSAKRQCGLRPDCNHGYLIGAPTIYICQDTVTTRNGWMNNSINQSTGLFVWQLKAGLKHAYN